MSANNKLKEMKEEGADERKIYNFTKNMGIKFCKELIKDDIEHLEFINKQKKQDDLCDAFLQAFYYIFCQNGVPTHISDIIENLTEKVN